jgi:hypothetical protein
MDEVLRKTNWQLLAQQKVALLGAIGVVHDAAEQLQGLLHFIDAVQDAAAAEGYPVVFLTDMEDDQ